MSITTSNKVYGSRPKDSFTSECENDINEKKLPITRPIINPVIAALNAFTAGVLPLTTSELLMESANDSLLTLISCNFEVSNGGAAAEGCCRIE